MSRLQPKAVWGDRALVVGLAAGAGLVVWGVLAPGPALHGWLIGFAFGGAVPLGALALLTVHSLTGGRWGDAARPALGAAASTLPIALLAAVPVFGFARWIYPWAADLSAAGADVGRLYLNVPFAALRSFVVLVILSGFSVAARRAPLPSLAAGLCLLVYGAGINLLAFDWLLSLDPHFNASAFGVQWIVSQLTAALSFAILFTAATAEEPVWGDFGALLLAFVLGLLYLVFMTFLIDWYGDLPDQAAWYLRRSSHGWLALELAGVTFGAVLPLIALLFAAVRGNPALLKLVAAAALFGIVAETIWLVAPDQGGAAAAAGVLGTVAVCGLLIGLGGRMSAAWPRDRSLVHDR